MPGTGKAFSVEESNFGALGGVGNGVKGGAVGEGAFHAAGVDIEHDAAVGEESERYRVTIARPDGGVRSVETIAPTLSIEAPDAGAVVTVMQQGTLAVSPPAHLTFSDLGA